MPLSTIRTVAETGSTNADMIALAKAGLAEGTWLRAERQIAGRGREGRGWLAPPGNFSGSTLVRLRSTDPSPPTLALVTGVALAEAVCCYLLPSGMPGVMLKWPNDLLIDGAKLAGVLLERIDDAVIVGIGVNIAHHPELEDRRTMSLAAMGSTVDAADFAETLAECFERWVRIWRGEGLEAVRRCWMKRAHPLGSPLSVRTPDGHTAEGLFDGIDADGALTLRLASGERSVIHAGDIFLL